MGFYGQVVYEFTKLFSKFLITQSSASEAPTVPPNESENIFFEADNMWEQINIEPTNRWIQLDGTGGNSNIKTIKIGHGTPGQSDSTKTLVSIEKVDSASPAPTQLHNDDIIKVATLTHDAAGHANGAPTYSYYKLPAPSLTIIAPDDEDDEDDNNISSDTNDTLSFKGDGKWISLTNNGNALKIKHALPEIDGLATNEKSEYFTLDCIAPAERTPLDSDGFLAAMEDDGKSEGEIAAMQELFNGPSLADIEIVPLQSGDLIKTNQIVRDLNGHILENNPIYYKLPVSATDVAFDDQKNRISAIEQLLTGEEAGELPEADPNYSYTKITEKIDEIGDLQNIYIDPSKRTIVDAIGKIDGKDSITEAINDLIDSTENLYTISEAIQALVQKLQEKESAIVTSQEAISGLSARLALIEARLKALEDATE